MLTFQAASLRRPAVATLVAALLAALPGCSSADPVTVSEASPAASAPADGPPEAAADLAALARAVTAAPEAARRAGTARYSFDVTSRVGDGPDQADAGGEGALDLAAGAGTMTFRMDLADLLGAPGSTPDPALQALADGVRLTWDAETLTAEVGGPAPHTRSRADAAESGGLIGRMPAEPAGLIAMLTHAEDVTPMGDGHPDGQARASARVPVEALSGQGVPAQATEAVAARMLGDALPIEVWLDGAGRPARIRYEIGSVVNPDRTTAVTYDYEGWGEPVELG